MKIGRPMQQVVLAAKSKTGFGSLIGEATLTGGLWKCFLVLPSVKAIFMCKFSDLCRWQSWLQRVKKCLFLDKGSYSITEGL